MSASNHLAPYDILIKAFGDDSTVDDLHSKPIDKLARKYNTRKDVNGPRLVFNTGAEARIALRQGYTDGSIDDRVIRSILGHADYAGTTLIVSAKRRDPAYFRPKSHSAPVVRQARNTTAQMAELINAASAAHASSHRGPLQGAPTGSQASSSRGHPPGGFLPTLTRQPEAWNPEPSEPRGLGYEDEHDSFMDTSLAAKPVIPPRQPLGNGQLTEPGGLEGVPPVDQPDQHNMVMELLDELRTSESDRNKTMMSKFDAIKVAMSHMATKTELNDGLNSLETKLTVNFDAKLDSLDKTYDTRLTRVESLANEVETGRQMDVNKVATEITKSAVFKERMNQLTPVDMTGWVKKSELDELERKFMKFVQDQKGIIMNELAKGSTLPRRDLPPHLLIAYANEYRRGAISYRNAVTANKKDGLLNLVITDRSKFWLNSSQYVIDERWLSELLSCAYRVLGKPHTSKKGNLVCKVKLVGLQPKELTGHMQTLHEGKRERLVGLNLSLVTPAAHNIDAVLHVWTKAGSLLKFDTTKKATTY